jgi:hypothetical protein
MRGLGKHRAQLYPYVEVCMMLRWHGYGSEEVQRALHWLDLAADTQIAE